MLYNLAIIIYDIAVHLAAPFSRKPRKMMKGHWVVYELLRQQLEKDARYIWFHAASLGEFEQGRPLIEKIRAKYPDYRILLTFFSPSGYEVRKNYPLADLICYLRYTVARVRIHALRSSLKVSFPIRQRQLRPTVEGAFILASFPSFIRSCIWIMATSAILA